MKPTNYTIVSKYYICLLLLIGIQSHSQTFVKFNTLTALVAVPNIGIETSIGEKTTLGVDVMASFWKSFAGVHPLKFATVTPEIRYHFKGKYDGWYIGGNVGADVYSLQKWINFNYPYYEKGFGYHLGGTVGYNFKLSEKFTLDAFLGGGWHQGFYKGYYNDGTPGRYETAKDYNKSGDWMPYRGGLMISYKL